MVPSRTRHWYREFESVQMAIGNLMLSSFSTVALITKPVSKPATIVYSSDAKTLLVTCLHLVDDQWMILALFLPSASTMRYPSWDEISLLLANGASVNE